MQRSNDRHGSSAPPDVHLPRHALRHVAERYPDVSQNTLRNWIDWLELSQSDSHRGDRLLSDRDVEVLGVALELKGWNTRDLIRLILALRPLEQVQKVMKEVQQAQ